MVTSSGRIPASNCRRIIAASWRRNDGQDRRKVLVGDGLHGDRFPDAACSSFRKGGDRLERLIHGDRDEFFFHGPLEDPDDTGNPVVDVLPRQGLPFARLRFAFSLSTFGDDLFADGFQPFGTEFVRGSVAVETDERSHRSLDSTPLIGGAAVLDVVRPGVVIVLDDQRRNAQILPRWNGQGARLAVAGILGDEPRVRLFAFRRTKGAEVEITPIDADTGLPPGGMGQIGGNLVRWTCHDAAPIQEFRGTFTTKSRTFAPHFPARKDVPQSGNRRVLRLSRDNKTAIELFLAGVTGWEAKLRRRFSGKSDDRGHP